MYNNTDVKPLIQLLFLAVTNLTSIFHETKIIILKLRFFLINKIKMKCI